MLAFSYIKPYLRTNYYLHKINGFVISKESTPLIRVVSFKNDYDDIYLLKGDLIFYNPAREKISSCEDILKSYYNLKDAINQTNLVLNFKGTFSMKRISKLELQQMVGFYEPICPLIFKDCLIDSRSHNKWNGRKLCKQRISDNIQ